MMIEEIKQVVVADSHSLFRDGLISLLEADGYQVLAQTGEAEGTLRSVGEYRPDLLLLDISLPDIGGLETLRAVKAEYPEVRVVLLTIQDRDEDLFDAIRSGADGYLCKDLSAEEFMDILGGLKHGEAAITRKTATRIMKGYLQDADEDVKERGCLSKRELELLHLVFEGHSNRMIAEQLFISENTVKYHIKNILQKLGVNNRTEAVSQALRAGIISKD